MKLDFPIRQFRLDKGYTFDMLIRGSSLDKYNLIIGGTTEGNDIAISYLGKLAEYGNMNTNIWLDLKGAHAIYIMGKRRSGKTYTLGAIAENLVSSQWIQQGDCNQAVLILDTMNVFATMHHNVIEVYKESSQEIQDLNKWGLENEDFPIVLYYPRGVTPPPEGNIQELTIRPIDLSAEDWAGVFGVDTYSDPIGQLIAELVDKVSVEGYEDSHTNIVPTNTNFQINNLIECLDESQEIQRFPIQTLEAVRRRLNAIDRQNIFSNTGVDVQEIFRARQISIVLLRDIDYHLRGLLIGVLVKKIREFRGLSDSYERLAAIQNTKAETLEQDNPIEAKKCRKLYEEYLVKAQNGLPRGWILIDEAHNYVPSKGIVASREPLKQYINEGRNLGLSIVVATQQPSGLDQAIRRNADILIIHSMSMRDDIETARSMLNTLVPDQVTYGNERLSSRVFEQLIRSLDLGYAIISNDNVNRIFPIKVRPRITIHGGKEY